MWDGSFTQTQATILEAVQRHAAQTVYNIPRTDHHTSTSQLINKLNWETLDSRREWRRLGLFRAIHFGEVATDMTEFIQIHPYSSSTRRHDQQYLIPHCNTDIHKKSFFISTAKLWNNLCSVPSLLVGPVAVWRFQYYGEDLITSYWRGTITDIWDWRTAGTFNRRSDYPSSSK